MLPVIVYPLVCPIMIAHGFHDSLYILDGSNIVVAVFVFEKENKNRASLSLDLQLKNIDSWIVSLDQLWHQVEGTKYYSNKRQVGALNAFYIGTR